MSVALPTLLHNGCLHSLDPPHRSVLLKLPCNPAVSLRSMILAFRSELTHQPEFYFRCVGRLADEGWTPGEVTPSAGFSYLIAGLDYFSVFHEASPGIHHSDIVYGVVSHIPRLLQIGVCSQSDRMPNHGPPKRQKAYFITYKIV